jgi:hypothetical protein
MVLRHRAAGGCRRHYCASRSRRSFGLRDKQLRVTISAGVAECAGRGGVRPDLLRSADGSCTAPAIGRDRVSPEK